MAHLPLSTLYCRTYNPSNTGGGHETECLTTDAGHSVKENSPVLVTELTGHTLKQRIQPLTMCFQFFQRKPSLSLQWMPSHSNANQKALAIWTEVKKKKKAKKVKSQKWRLCDFVTIIASSFFFFTDSSIKNHRETSKKQDFTVSLKYYEWSTWVESWNVVLFRKRTIWVQLTLPRQWSTFTSTVWTVN